MQHFRRRSRQSRTSVRVIEPPAFPPVHRGLRGRRPPTLSTRRGGDGEPPGRDYPSWFLCVPHGPRKRRGVRPGGILRDGEGRSSNPTGTLVLLLSAPSSIPCGSQGALRACRRQVGVAPAPEDQFE